MNWDHIQGNWKEFSGRIRQRWGNLTDNDLAKIAGHREKLIGTLQKSYGLAKDHAELQVREFEKTLH